VKYDLKKFEWTDVTKITTNCVSSYLYYHKSKYYQEINDYFLSLTGGKWEVAVRWFVTNSARAVKRKGTGFFISLSQRHYSDNKMGIGYRQVRSLLELLDEKGYIDIYKGFQQVNRQTGESINRMSCLLLTDKTLAKWRNVLYIPNLWEEYDKKAGVVVRIRGTKDTKELDDTAYQFDNMHEYNKSLREANITYGGQEVAAVQYQRIFLDNLETAGRLYVVGGGVQLIPQKLRASELKINGENVVELDYSAIHPNICYEYLSTDDNQDVRDMMGQNFHPYNVDLSFVEVDEGKVRQWEEKYGAKCNPRRQLAKLAILVGMNSKDFQSAVFGLANKIREDKSKKEESEQMMFGTVGTIPCGEILRALQEHNSLIADRFFSDAGVYLQNVDSSIIMEVVSEMIQKGHTILTYHDSCIVAESAEKDLLQAMKSAWKKILGGDKFCKVEKK
jgi:hypothetical protein